MTGAASCSRRGSRRSSASPAASSASGGCTRHSETSSKPILIAGNLASALGYAGFAFVDRPWQAFACAVIGGAGFGVANTANQVLSLTLVPAEQRASSIALRRVAGNFGLGSG